MNKRIETALTSLTTEFATKIASTIRAIAIEEILGGTALAAHTPSHAGSHAAGVTPRRKPGPKPGRKPGRKPGPKPASAPSAVAAPASKPGPKPAQKPANVPPPANRVEFIVAALKKHPKGIRAEHLRAELKLSREHMSKAINDAITAKKVRKTGDRRTTTYFAV